MGVCKAQRAFLLLSKLEDILAFIFSKIFFFVYTKQIQVRSCSNMFCYKIQFSIPFWAAAPQRRCPIECREYFVCPYVHTSVCTYVRMSICTSGLQPEGQVPNARSQETEECADIWMNKIQYVCSQLIQGMRM